MPRRRKKSRSFGWLPDSTLLLRVSDSEGHDADMHEFFADAVRRGDCAKAYDGLRDTLRGDGFREALIRTIDADPDRGVSDRDIMGAIDKHADIWARFVEQEDKFRRKCLRLTNEIPLESRLVAAKKRKK